MVDRRECLGHGLDAVAAEVLHQVGQFVIAAAVDQGRDRPLIAQILQASTDVGALQKFSAWLGANARLKGTALQDAASVAGLLITTEAMVAELPKKEAAHPPMPGGGMGGMGGMDF